MLVSVLPAETGYGKVGFRRVLYYFALRINASVVLPFYTDLFSSYTWDTNSSDIISNYNLRQPVFYEFQSLATLYGLPA